MEKTFDALHGILVLVSAWPWWASHLARTDFQVRSDATACERVVTSRSLGERCKDVSKQPVLLSFLQLQMTQLRELIVRAIDVEKNEDADEVLSNARSRKVAVVSGPREQLDAGLTKGSKWWTWGWANQLGKCLENLLRQDEGRKMADMLRAAMPIPEHCVSCGVGCKARSL